MIGPRGLLDVETFVLDAAVLHLTVAALQHVGFERNEGFVLLGGALEEEGRVLTFRSSYWPDQTPRHAPDGLLVEVAGEALHTANLAFYRRGEIMAGQVHTHPTDAFHSPIDDHFPLVTLLGAISIVIPDFATGGIESLDRWAFYRLASPAVWRSVTDGEIEVRG